MPPEQIQYDPQVHVTPGGGDDSLLVRFFIDAVHDPVASAKEGRPIYKDAEWIDIRIPGNRDNIVIRPVRPGDIDRFPRHYAAFKLRMGKEGEDTVGTPLSTWPWAGMSPARIKELHHFNVRTVEQLSALPDSTGGRIMGFQAMKQAAAAYLTATRAQAPILALQAKLEAAMLRIDELGAALAKASGGDPALIVRAERPKPDPDPEPEPEPGDDEPGDDEPGGKVEDSPQVRRAAKPKPKPKFRRR